MEAAAPEVVRACCAQLGRPEKPGSATPGARPGSACACESRCYLPGADSCPAAARAGLRLFSEPAQHAHVSILVLWV